jgi:hypothetical protein
MQSHLAEAWGEFLGRFPWDWFCTLTFRDPVPSFTAHRRFEYFARDLERAAGQPIAWFRGDEYGPRGGRLHIHALIANVANLDRFTWMARWENRNGYARIFIFDPTQGAAYYCAKYVTKQFGDWDLSNDLEAFKTYQPILNDTRRRITR